MRAMAVAMSSNKNNDNDFYIYSMLKIKTYNQFNSSDWFGPVKVLDIRDGKVYTNSGTFVNNSLNQNFFKLPNFLK